MKHILWINFFYVSLFSWTAWPRMDESLPAAAEPSCERALRTNSSIEPYQVSLNVQALSALILSNAQEDFAHGRNDRWVSWFKRNLKARAVDHHPQKHGQHGIDNVHGQGSWSKDSSSHQQLLLILSRSLSLFYTLENKLQLTSEEFRVFQKTQTQLGRILPKMKVEFSSDANLFSVETGSHRMFIVKEHTLYVNEPQFSTFVQHFIDDENHLNPSFIKKVQETWTVKYWSQLFGLVFHEFGHMAGIPDTEDRILDRVATRIAITLEDLSEIISLESVGLPEVHFGFVNKTVLLPMVIMTDGLTTFELSGPMMSVFQNQGHTQTPWDAFDFSNLRVGRTYSFEDEVLFRGSHLREDIKVVELLAEARRLNTNEIIPLRWTLHFRYMPKYKKYILDHSDVANSIFLELPTPGDLERQRNILAQINSKSVAAIDVSPWRSSEGVWKFKMPLTAQIAHAYRAVVRAEYPQGPPLAFEIPGQIFHDRSLVEFQFPIPENREVVLFLEKVVSSAEGQETEEFLPQDQVKLVLQGETPIATKKMDGVIISTAKRKDEMIHLKLTVPVQLQTFLEDSLKISLWGQVTYIDRTQVDPYFYHSKNLFSVPLTKESKYLHAGLPSETMTQIELEIPIDSLIRTDSGQWTKGTIKELNLSSIRIYGRDLSVTEIPLNWKRQLLYYWAWKQKEVFEWPETPFNSEQSDSDPFLNETNEYWRLYQLNSNNKR